MKRNSKRLPLALFGLALIFPLVLPAAPPAESMEGKPGCHPPFTAKPFDAEHLPPHLNTLNLSDTQRAQIIEVFKTQGAGLRDKFEAVKKAHEALRGLSQSAEFSDDKAKVLAESGAQAQTEADLAHAQLDHAIYQVLTPTQQQQLKAFEARKDSALKPQ